MKTIADKSEQINKCSPEPQLITVIANSTLVVGLDHKGNKLPVIAWQVWRQGDLCWTEPVMAFGQWQDVAAFKDMATEAVFTPAGLVNPLRELLAQEAA